MSDIEYAFARMSARLGARPDEAAWHRLETVRGYAGALDVARATPHAEWVDGIAHDSDAHAIDAALRARWRDAVAEVATWMPDAWQPAVGWTAVLADVPVLEHLARGGEALRWIASDPAYRDLAIGAAESCPAALTEGPLAPFASAWRDPDRLFDVWHKTWEARLPRLDASGRAGRAMLARLLRAHAVAIGAPALRDAWPLRRALQLRLLQLFRRILAEPIAAFVYLAIVALDLERLRGELVRRAAFPAGTALA